MRILGISPTDTFSGFQKTFFDAVEMQGAEFIRIGVKLRLFKLLCTLMSFNPKKSIWGPRRSHLYFMSIPAFKMKSKHVQRRVKNISSKADAIYQIGSLWDPIGDDIDLPLYLQLSYTSKLSIKLGGWPIRPGVEQKFRLEQEHSLFNKSKLIFTTTENARQSVISDYNIAPEKVIVSGAGVSPPYDDLDPNRYPNYYSKKMLFVGKGFEGKGLDTILEAFKIVRDNNRDSKLTVVGPSSFNIKMENVSYLGRIADREAVKKLYYEHSFYVMPSRFEPFGQVFIEAMSCQLPCIGSKRDAMPEIIDHGKTGYLIEPGDHISLAKYMTNLLENPDLCAKMGRQGFEKLLRTYTWPIVGKKLYSHIKASIN